MPKNKGKNAFYFFMLDWKRRAEAAGRKFPNGLKDVQCDEQCSTEWQTMAKQQKGYYIAKAKDSKIEAQGCMEKKTTTRESVHEIEERRKKEIEFEQTMHQYIESIVSMGTQHKNVDKLKFVFIHVNMFYVRELGNNKYDYLPAEFAVAVFSLENGIEGVYHEIINEKIPLGLRRSAIETSQQTHQIPVELPEGENDYALMFSKLVSFLQPTMIGNKFPPLFSSKDCIPTVDSLLRRMTSAANEDRDKFLVYSIEALFGAMRNAAVQNTQSVNITLVVAEKEFLKNTFSTVQGIECMFHKNIDGTTQYCSMAVVKQWGFIFCDYCCEYLDIKMVPGVHCPDNYWGSSAANDDSLDISINRLTLQNSAPTILPLSGVSAEYRLKVSARTYEEEQRRRLESKPIQVIYHDTNSMLNGLSTPAVNERPLRLPKTKSNALFEAERSSCYSLSDDEFPPIGGRGIAQKARNTQSKLPLRRGQGRR